MDKKTHQTTREDFERIFHPQRIAIVGVSTENAARGFGTGMLTALKAMGFEGNIFPVNPKGGNFAGLKIYKQVEDIPEKIDFAIYCPRSGLTLLPGPDLSRQSGPVAFLSQSGGMAIDFAHKGKWMGIAFSKIVSFGNGADLRETELLRYLADDQETG